MENSLKYETDAKTDWFKQYRLSSEQVSKLIADKIEKAKIQSMAIKNLREKVGS